MQRANQISKQVDAADAKRGKHVRAGFTSDLHDRVARVF